MVPVLSWRVRNAAAVVALWLVVSAARAAAAADWSEERAIFTAEAARKSWASLYRFRSGSTPWTPALDDVLALEKALPDYIRGEFTRQRRQLKSKNPLWERAKTYKRQYVGIRYKARRAVYANFFCTDFGVNWRTEPIGVDDGGDCFFTVEYDVDKGTFSNFIVNGKA